jgi:hypothetical protein
VVVAIPMMVGMAVVSRVGVQKQRGLVVVVVPWGVPGRGAPGAPMLRVRMGVWGATAVKQ